jgi:PIN domain nuclease of toxin-antitoxin system
MKVLLDTNVVVDILSKRGGYEDSLRILALCEMCRITGFVSAVTVTDVMYILRKHISPDTVRSAVQTLLIIVKVEDVLKSDISAAFSSDMKDLGINYLTPHPPPAGTRRRTRRNSAGLGGKQGVGGDSAGIMRSQVYSSHNFLSNNNRLALLLTLLVSLGRRSPQTAVSSAKHCQIRQ